MNDFLCPKCGCKIPQTLGVIVRYCPSCGEMRSEIKNDTTHPGQIPISNSEILSQTIIKPFPGQDDNSITSATVIKSSGQDDVFDTSTKPDMTNEVDMQVVFARHRVRSEGFAYGDLVGEYEVLEALGQGGMGVVVKARHKKLDNIVAIKILVMSDNSAYSALDRFLREARTVAKLKHTNIVGLFELGKTKEGLDFFTMDYVKGQTLNDMIKNSSLSVDATISLIRVVAEAVNYAHENSVIHRDIKPHNIIVDKDMKPHILDFGLAKNLNDETNFEISRSGMVMGTFAYMPPEQARGDVHNIDARSDIYALGAVMYEMLTGRPPLSATSQMNMLVRICEDEPVAPRELNPSISKDLNTIVMKCLEKKKVDRYKTAFDLADDLRRIVESEPIKARRPNPLKRTALFVQRNKGAAIICFMLVFSLSAGLGGALANLRRAQDAENIAKKEIANAKRTKENALKIVKQLATSEKIVSAKNYLAGVRLAHREFSLNELKRAEDALFSCDEKLRNWEWRWLLSSLHPERLILKNTGQRVRKIHATKNGRYALMAIVKNDKEFLGVWDMQTGARVLVWETHLQAVSDFALSASGLFAATASWDGSVSLWSVKTGKKIRTWAIDNSGVTTLAFSPAQNRLIAGTNSGKLVLMNLNNDEVLKKWNVLPDGGVRSVAFSRDGRKVICADSSGVIRWLAVRSGSWISEYLLKENSIREVVGISNKQFAAISRSGNIYIWQEDKISAEPKIFNTKIDNIKSISVDYQKNLVAFATNNSIKLVSLSNGKTVKEFLGHTDKVQAVAMVAEKNELISGSVLGDVRVWENALENKLQNKIDGEFLSGIEIDGNFLSVQLMPNGELKKITNGFEKNISVECSKPVVLSKKFIWGVHKNKSVACWSLEDNSKFSTSFAVPFPDVHTMAVDESNSAIVVSNKSGMCIAFNPKTKTQKTLPSDSGSKMPVIDVSTEGALIGDSTGRVRIWNLDTNTIRSIHAHEEAVASIKWFPQKTRFLTISTDNTLAIWDASSLVLNKRINGHLKPITAVALSADETRLATAGEDNSVRIWDVSRGDELLVFSDTPNIKKLIFSKDGETLIAVAKNGKIQKWSARKNK